MKLDKAIYGLVQAARQFWKKLTSKLKEAGFKPNIVDPCLFQCKDYRGLSILTMYDRILSKTPGAEPPRDVRDSGSARSHSTHLETSSSDRP